MLQCHVSRVILAIRAAPHRLADCKQPVYGCPQSLQGRATEAYSNFASWQGPRSAFPFPKMMQEDFSSSLIKANLTPRHEWRQMILTRL